MPGSVARLTPLPACWPGPPPAWSRHPIGRSPGASALKARPRFVKALSPPGAARPVRGNQPARPGRLLPSLPLSGSPHTDLPYGRTPAHPYGCASCR